MTTLGLSVASVLALMMWIFSMLAAFFLGQCATIRAQYRHRETLLSSFGDIWDRLTGAKEEDKNEDE